ncbi:sulfurtransferase TusA family protein [Marinomonas sp. 15G1-11]|uniref:Sulfurtransferase TusA family protein n=1 Tax=Marinomonas phaeophyticola TaxID=3004091 RepID=A0ABT4JPI7_9GAMM|nr:sulfurtransferase TusA family protein [Marinomonas sp. 15G1-11]MCZ2720211.1 sulfurtransferase TusA family protein [Marinomonas sp. 15G1-11]
MSINTIHKYDVLVDASGDRCPMPLLKMKMALAKMSLNEVLCIVTTDAASKKDIPYYLSLTELYLIEQFDEGDVFTFVVRKN